MSHLFQSFQKKHLLFLAGILTAQVAAVHGNEPSLDAESSAPYFFNEQTSYACDPCTDPFAWGATLLYLQPNVDDTHYVLSSFDTTNISYLVLVVSQAHGLSMPKPGDPYCVATQKAT